jgi:hypothetical protein
MSLNLGVMRAKDLHHVVKSGMDEHPKVSFGESCAHISGSQGRGAVVGAEGGVYR